MTRDESPDEQAPADEALAVAARAGDDDAFAELWRRHAPAGATAARQYAHIADADDLLAEAYARILASFRRGNGPSGSFRPYLYRTIRNLAMDWRRPATVALDDTPDGELLLPGPEPAVVERALGFRAFRSLPPRWQSVLWYLEVEGLEPAEAAPLLGLSPNATSALAGRAREGLKKAWLQAHVGEHGVPDGCRWTTDRMGEYSRGGPTRRGRERFARHLETCVRCTELLAEVEDAGGRLAVILLPFLVGGSGLAGVLAERGAGADATAADAGDRAGASRPGARAAATSSAATRPALVAVGAVLVVAVVTGVTLAFGLPGSPGEVELPTAESPWPTEEPTPPEETPEPTPDPTPEPTPAPSPPRVTPPVAPPPVVPPPAPVAPAAPSAPVADLAHNDATGLLRLSGTGDVPGATIEVWGWTTSLDPPPYVTSPAVLLASAVVGPDGSWSTPDAGGLTPIKVTVTVRQVRDGLSSAPVEVITNAFFDAKAVPASAVVAGSTATWNLLGWPGAAWEIREPGGGPTVASGVFASDGTAVATVTLPAAPSGTVLDYDYGYVQDGAMSNSLTGLTATAP